MGCQVVRDNNGNIEWVEAPNGQESILYKTIEKNVGSKEAALAPWAKVYTPTFKKTFGDWLKDPQSVAGMVDKNGEPLYKYAKAPIKEPKVLPESLAALQQELINGFLKDFNITVVEYDSIKDDLGVDAYTMSDLVTKIIAHEKGESILPEVAYFAYSMLGRQNNKLRSDLRYLVNKWSKYKERFEYHSDTVLKNEGFIQDKRAWRDKIRDKVIIDFLAETIGNFNTKEELEKVTDTKWTAEDFTLWQKIKKAINDFFTKALYGDNRKKKLDKLNTVARSIADDILTRNYKYFDYGLSEDQVRKYYNNTIESDSFAKELVEFGQKEMGIVLTGSLALRRAGTVYRTTAETLHDIDWVVPYDVNNKNPEVIAQIQRFQGNDKTVSADMALKTIDKFDWFKQFKERYPSFQLINGFYGAEHGSFESFTVQGVIDGQFREEDGFHNEEFSYYKKSPDGPVKVKEVRKVAHKKGDWITNTGYAIDFFVRLEPNQEEHENYFKLWKEIMIAKLQMGREKDFSDWKAFVPYLKSQNSFNFNYEGFRHINYADQANMLDDSEVVKENSSVFSFTENNPLNDECAI